MAGTSQAQSKNEGMCKGEEGGQNQGIVQGPQDTSNGDDIWHLAPEVGEIKLGRGQKSGNRGNSHQDPDKENWGELNDTQSSDPKTGVTISAKEGEENTKVSTPTREKEGKGFMEKVRTSPIELTNYAVNWFYRAGGEMRIVL